MKGGVIVIGSLRWENEENCIQERDSKALAGERKNWRNECLNLTGEKVSKLPIRYGRSSSSRKCTYTMVFSNLALNKESYGLIIPYKDEIDFSNYLNFERQALKISEIEGISKRDNRMRKVWGCIGLYINPKSEYINELKRNWETLKLIDTGYSKSSSQYRFLDKYDESLLNEDYTLSEVCSIDTDCDFLFFTYIKPLHRNDLKKEFPTPKIIAEEIIRSGYRTYFEENVNAGIATFEDEEISSYLNSKN